MSLLVILPYCLTVSQLQCAAGADAYAKLYPDTSSDGVRCLCRSSSWCAACCACTLDPAHLMRRHETIAALHVMQVLRLGNIVPDFTATSTQGEIHWHDWIDGKWAILFSHPADFTRVPLLFLAYFGCLLFLVCA